MFPRAPLGSRRAWLQSRQTGTWWNVYASELTDQPTITYIIVSNNIATLVHMFKLSTTSRCIIIKAGTD